MTEPHATMPASDANTSPQLGRIRQIALTVNDVPRAVSFYRDALGIRQLDIPAPPSLAFFDCDGVRLMLSLPETPNAGKASTVLYFSVPDIHAAAQTLAQRGVRFVDEPHLIARMPDHELWMTFFTDPDLNPLALMSEVR
jgi:methylmalonyl-CoA/ethylmalonyl-CoA epimerase